MFIYIELIIMFTPSQKGAYNNFTKPLEHTSDTSDQENNIVQLIPV